MAKPSRINLWDNGPQTDKLSIIHTPIQVEISNTTPKPVSFDHHVTIATQLSLPSDSINNVGQKITDMQNEIDVLRTDMDRILSVLDKANIIVDGGSVDGITITGALQIT